MTLVWTDSVGLKLDLAISTLVGLETCLHNNNTPIGTRLPLVHLLHKLDLKFQSLVKAC